MTDFFQQILSQQNPKKTQEAFQQIKFEDIEKIIALYQENQQLKSQMEQLEQERITRKKIMDEHLHNCKNVTFPKTVFEVAKELSRGTSEREKMMAQDLMYAYVAQMRMDTDSKLLKLKLETAQSGDFVQEFRKFLREKNAAPVGYIVQECLMLTIFRILMTQEDILDQGEYALSQEKTMEELRCDFWQETIHPSTGKFDILDWFSREIYPFHLEISSEWDEVKFLKQGCAFVYLAQMITNVMINSLNYGVKDRNGYISMSFTLDYLENQEFFSINVRNPVEKESAFLQGTGYGMDSLKTSVARLNEEENLEKYTEITEEQGEFSIKMWIKQDTLGKEGR